MRANVELGAGPYNFLMPGHNLGANCTTFAYLAGKSVAAEV